MIYGDGKIKRGLICSGCLENTDMKFVNPASLNIRLGNTFLKLVGGQDIRLGEEVSYKRYVIQDGEEIALEPGEFLLATTKEYIRMPKNCSAFVQGRSSIGRIGLTIQNAGYIDPGFEGEITLELMNDGNNLIYLTPGYPVGQMVFFDVCECETPYHGKYSGQRGATGSRMQFDNEAPKG